MPRKDGVTSGKTRAIFVTGRTYNRVRVNDHKTITTEKKKFRIYSKIQKHSCKKICTTCNMVTAHYLLFSLQIL